MAESNKLKKKPYQVPDLEPGDNTKYINHSMTIMKWDKPDMGSLEAVQKRCFDYFSLCAENDFRRVRFSFRCRQDDYVAVVQRSPGK